MISFQNRIDNKYFSCPIFSETSTKNIFILSNSHSIIYLNLGALGFDSMFSVEAE